MSHRRLNPQSIFLHWLVFLLFVTAITGIEYRDLLPSGDPLRRTLRAIHMMTGQLIFLFSVLRLALRFRFRRPPATDVARWMAWSARAMHVVLYFVMFAQPLSGVLYMQAGDRDVVFFGWVLPRLIDGNKELYFAIKEMHQFIGHTFYVLALLHALAALWHHFVLKDDSLRSMLKRHRKG